MGGEIIGGSFVGVTSQHEMDYFSNQLLPKVLLKRRLNDDYCTKSAHSRVPLKNRPSNSYSHIPKKKGK